SASEIPVTNVTVFDAMAYAAHTGKVLPTEAQWARAAYGLRKSDDGNEDAETNETNDTFPWGDTWTERAANVATQTIAPVGSYDTDVSLFGMRDAVGNVAEWTMTKSSKIPYGASADDPAGIGFGD